MISYLRRRALTIVPTIVGVTFILFLCLSMTPEAEHPFPRHGNFAGRFTRWAPGAVPVYVRWLGRALRFDLGMSKKDFQPVTTRIASRLPATLELNVATLVITVLVGIPLGAICAYYKGRWPDRVLSGFTFVLFSMPAFWVGLLLIILFGVKIPEWTSYWFGYRIGLPTSGRQTVTITTASLAVSRWQVLLDYMHHLILPAITSAIVSTATMARLSRIELLEVLGSEFIVTAKAKGSGPIKIIWHALANALLPAVTLLSMMVPAVIGSSLIIENVFSWPGIGRLGYEAILARDYPLVMGIGFTVAILTIAAGFVADLIYGYLDPRVRLSREVEE